MKIDEKFSEGSRRLTHCNSSILQEKNIKNSHNSHIDGGCLGDTSITSLIFYLLYVHTPLPPRFHVRCVKKTLSTEENRSNSNVLIWSDT